jgi:nicotinamidase-related amidase
VSSRGSSCANGWSVVQACRSVVIVVTSLVVWLSCQWRLPSSATLIGMAAPDLSAHALVLVDVQEGLVPASDPFVSRLSEAVAAARAAGVPVVHVRDTRDPSDGDLVLDPGQDTVVAKSDDDAFVSTPLADLLSSAGATRVCLAGIQSEMCVAATARGAHSRGLTVVLPRDGHRTFDVPADGAAPPVAAGLVARVAEWSLGDEVVAPDRLADVRFARGEP